MGFFSDLLNPVKAFKRDDIVGKLVNGGGGGGGSSAPAQAAPDPMAGTYGNPNDPSYGSFTQPFDVQQFYNYADPGYAFQLQQGTQALQNSAAAGSGSLSGSALKDLLKYNQDYAGTAYNDAFNRYQTQQGNIFSRLSSLATLGQNAAAGVGAQGTQLAGQAGQAMTNAGTAAGAGIVGAGNAASGGLTNYWLMKQFGGAGGGTGGGIYSGNGLTPSTGMVA